MLVNQYYPSPKPSLFTNLHHLSSTTIGHDSPISKMIILTIQPINHHYPSLNHHTSFCRIPSLQGLENVRFLLGGVATTACCSATVESAVLRIEEPLAPAKDLRGSVGFRRCAIQLVFRIIDLFFFAFCLHLLSVNLWVITRELSICFSYRS